MSAVAARRDERRWTALALPDRLAAAMRRAGAAGAIVGVWADGARQTAAIGPADWESHEPLRPDTRLPVASLTKPMLATAAVRAWQQRGIPLDTPLVELLPELAEDWRASRRLSLRHLLSHTSGLRPAIPPVELARYGFAADALEQAVRATVRSGQIRPLGSCWRYSNPGYALAGYALGVVAGNGLRAALRDHLLDPAGMSQTSFQGAQASGHLDHWPVRGVYSIANRPAGGMISTVDDLLRFAEFVVGDGSLPAMAHTVAASTFGAPYGLGWVGAHRWRVCWHLGDWGGCHAMLALVPDRRVAVAVLANDDGGTALRDPLVWGELTRLTGLRPPGNLTKMLYTGRCLSRGGLAAIAAAVRPRGRS